MVSHGLHALIGEQEFVGLVELAIAAATWSCLDEAERFEGSPGWGDGMAPNAVLGKLPIRNDQASILEPAMVSKLNLNPGEESMLS